MFRRDFAERNQRIPEVARATHKNNKKSAVPEDNEEKKVIAQYIGIVSPYRAQLQKLRDVLHDDIEIRSAEYFQERRKLNKSTIADDCHRQSRNSWPTRKQGRLWSTFVHYCHKNFAFFGEPFHLKAIPAVDEEIVHQMSINLRTIEKREERKGSQRH